MSKKAVVDAVNDLRGEFESLSNYPFVSDNAIKMILFNSFKNKYYGASLFLGSEGWSKVCTIEEFNQCVAEMSEGLFVPDCRPKQPEIQYDGYGNGLEFGAIYEFSDCGVAWCVGQFSEYSKRVEKSYIDNDGYHWKLIRELKSPIGKIHIKPVELVDGAAYQFNARNKIFNGIYEKDGNKFNVFSGQYFDEISCSNIIRLVPEVK